jgi:putative tricarboxylic transport membrane protein
MKKIDLTSSIILLLLSLVMLFEAGKLDIGTLNLPKEGLLPVVLAILLFILSLVLLARSIGGKRESTRSEKAPGMWHPKRIGSILGLLGLAVFFERLGYVLSTLAFLIFLLGVIERQKWWTVFAVACLSSLISYIMLGSLLDSPLPKGILGW